MRTPTKSNPIREKISKSPTGNASKGNPTNHRSRTSNPPGKSNQDEPTVFGFLWKKAKQLMSIFYNVLLCIQNCKAVIRKVRRLPI